MKGKGMVDDGKGIRSDSPWRRVIRYLLHDWIAVAGMTIIGLLALIAILAPMLAPRDPYEVRFALALAEPSPEHRLGNDAVGRDVLSRLIYGTRISLSIGLVVALIQVVLGGGLGLVAGIYGGWVDSIIMRTVDMLRAFPRLLLIVLMVSVLGPSIYNVMAVLGFLGWPVLARIVRAEVLSLREQEFVAAARSIGGGTWHIMIRHMLPNLIAPITVAATFGMARAIIAEAGLSFLGLGVQPPLASWGGMLHAAMSFNVLLSRPWLWVPPGVAIFVSVLSINFLGDGLRDAFDPNLWR